MCLDVKVVRARRCSSDLIDLCLPRQLKPLWDEGEGQGERERKKNLHGYSLFFAGECLLSSTWDGVALLKEKLLLTLVQRRGKAMRRSLGHDLVDHMNSHLRMSSVQCNSSPWHRNKRARHVSNFTWSFHTNGMPMVVSRWLERA